MTSLFIGRFILEFVFSALLQIMLIIVYFIFFNIDSLGRGEAYEKIEPYKLKVDKFDLNYGFNNLFNHYSLQK
jgi:hypothetical protein